MEKLYIYGGKIEKIEKNDFKMITEKFNKMPLFNNSYKAIGIEKENISCDIIVLNNGHYKISQDYKKIGLNIDLNFWADLFYHMGNDLKLIQD